MHHDPETIVKAQVWSMVLPPDDRHALEKVLSKMASSEESIQRFQSVEKVSEIER
jgi:ABC-type phosphate/phosphonate transport system substrate-binding protein